MLDFGYIPTNTGAADVQFFIGAAQADGTDWQTWIKPRGKTMIDIVLVGKGGNGGTGAIINTGGGGGGGGGSGAQSRLRMPLHLLPDVLFLSLLGQGSSASGSSHICVIPPISGTTIVATNVLVLARNGSTGTNVGVTATGGAGGSGGPQTIAGSMPLGAAFMNALNLAGQTGTAGGDGTGAGTAGVALTLPVTGLLVTGGTGGGGCPATAALPGQPGGAFTSLGFVPAHLGGTAGTGTTPPSSGTGGYRPFPNLGYWLGGTGGGATGSNSTGAGLVQAQGGDGAPGCGGGGGGAAFTGSVAGRVGLGGPAFCIITCW